MFLVSHRTRTRHRRHTDLGGPLRRVGSRRPPFSPDSRKEQVPAFLGSLRTNTEGSWRESPPAPSPRPHGRAWRGKRDARSQTPRNRSRAPRPGCEASLNITRSGGHRDLLSTRPRSDFHGLTSNLISISTQQRVSPDATKTTVTLTFDRLTSPIPAFAAVQESRPGASGFHVRAGADREGSCRWSPFRPDATRRVCVSVSAEATPETFLLMVIFASWVFELGL